MKKWHIFFILWVAWAGKGTVLKRLLSDKDLNLNQVLSVKTRVLRVWEQDWKDYIYKTKEDFEESIINNEFLEYNFVHNQNYYGTRFDDIVKNWIEKWKNMIKEIDMLIVPKILEEKKIKREDMVLIYIDIPIDKIKERMIERGDDISGEDYDNRIRSAKKEIELSYLADYIVNGTRNKEEVYQDVKNIILKKI